MALITTLGGKPYSIQELVRLSEYLLHRWNGQFELKTANDDTVSGEMTVENGAVTSVRIDGVDLDLKDLEGDMIMVAAYMLGAHGKGGSADFVNELNTMLSAAIRGALSY